jgi:hypothetical protein
VCGTIIMASIERGRINCGGSCNNNNKKKWIAMGVIALVIISELGFLCAVRPSTDQPGQQQQQQEQQNRINWTAVEEYLGGGGGDIGSGGSGGRKAFVMDIVMKTVPKIVNLALAKTAEQEIMITREGSMYNETLVNA